MRSITRVMAALLLVTVLAVRAHADEDVIRYHQPAPGAAIGAAFINVIQMPLRLIATTAVGMLGGFTGFMLGGDRQSAWDVFNLAGGDQLVTPMMLEGRETYKFTSYDPRSE